MMIKCSVNSLQLVCCLSLCCGLKVAYADIQVSTGPTHPLPTTFAISAKSIQFSPAQIQRLSKQAAQLKPDKGGFQALTTSLKHCQTGYAKRVHIEHLSHPLFIVGDDPVSLQWLNQNHQALQTSHAVGLIIQASSINSLQKIQTAAGSLALYPAKANAVSERFGIDCYPVLISQHLIEG